MELTEKLIEETKELEEALCALLLELAVLPAPSLKEEARARFCKEFLERAGATGVYIDEALNVIYPIGCENNGPISLFMAHTDLVFPDETPLPLKTDEERIYCPGIGDNDANLAALLTVGAYIARKGLSPRQGGVLLVANAAEEGLGNLKGCKAVMAAYGHRIKEVVSFDSMNESFAVNRACRFTSSDEARISLLTTRASEGRSFSPSG